MDPLRQKLLKLCVDAEGFFSRLPCTTLDDSSLAKYSIRRGTLFDVDVPGNLGSQPQQQPCFFEPFPDTPELGYAVAERHLDIGEDSWMGCPETRPSRPCAHRRYCAHRTIHWFTGMICYVMMDLGVGNKSWLLRDTLCNMRHDWPLYLGSRDHPELYDGLPGEERPEWMGNTVFFARGKPHTGCVVAESAVHKDQQVLRSEVVTALYLIRHHIEHRWYPGHTIPVIIYAVGHSDTARITQFHFDGSDLVFRQSRLFNIASPELLDVLDDAILLLRWMQCEPVGQTKMGT